jgi:hypothetical protein
MDDRTPGGRHSHAKGKGIPFTKLILEREGKFVMDWIEQLFGISPDGGDGTTEGLIVTACCIVVLVLLIVRFPKIRQFLGRVMQ